MMSLPFIGLFASFAFIWAGQRGTAIALWVLSIAMLLMLFHLHATDPLDIVL